MKTIRIGIIGTGGMANHHVGQYRKITGVEVVSGFDVVPGRAEAFAKQHGMPHAAKSIADLLSRVDAVSVVTPDRFHLEPSLAALKAGKHLLCEKPLCPTLAEARTLARAAKAAARKGIVSMVNFSYRASAAYQKAIDHVRAGKLGELRHVYSFYMQSWLCSDDVLEHEGLVWRLKTSAGSGGVLGDLGCHILDMTTAVAGDTPKPGFVKKVRCALATFPKKTKKGYVTTEKGGKLDANDSAVIELLLPNGALAVVQTSRWAAGHGNHLWIEAAGTDGALRFDLDRGVQKLTLQSAGGDGGTWNPIGKTRELDLKSTPDNWRRFLTSIRSGKADQPDIARGAQVQAYLDACERSAKSGGWVSVGSWL